MVLQSWHWRIVSKLSKDRDWVPDFPSEIGVGIHFQTNCAVINQIRGASVLDIVLWRLLPFTRNSYKLGSTQDNKYAHTRENTEFLWNFPNCLRPHSTEGWDDKNRDLNMQDVQNTRTSWYLFSQPLIFPSLLLSFSLGQLLSIINPRILLFKKTKPKNLT